MKRILSRVTAIFLTVLLLIPLACAYDYREDKLPSELRGQEQEILDAITSLKPGTSAKKEGVVLYENAVKLYRFEWNDFISHLKKNTLSKALQNHEWTVWIAPIAGYDQGRAVVWIGEEGFSTALSEFPQKDMVYLYAPEEIEAALEGECFDSVYMTEIPSWNVTFLTVIRGDEVKLMPFAARPEFLKVENSRWYTADEMVDVLETYASDTEFDGVASGGGGGRGIYWYELVHSLLPVVVPTGLIVAFLVWRKKQKENSKR